LAALTGPRPFYRYIGALGARVICDNIPGLVSRQRQLCQRYPDIMRSVGEGAREWIRECQHQFRHHRWNCTTLDRDHTVFGRVMLRSRGLLLPAAAPSFPMLGVVSGKGRQIPSLLSHTLHNQRIKCGQSPLQPETPRQRPCQSQCSEMMTQR
jgi:hypothetical protein